MTKTLSSIAIAGVAGRMGRTLVASARGAEIEIAGGSEAPGSSFLETDIGVLGGGEPLGLMPQTDVSAAAATAEVFIDFTTPRATLSALDALTSTDVKAVVIGTTGFTDADDAKIAEHANRLAIVKAGNFSIGINLLEALTKLAVSRLGEGWDIEILETHHRRKVDAPSGTALMLGHAAAEGRGASLSDLQAPPYLGTDAKRKSGDIGFSVRRSGGVIGEHEVTIASDQEVLTLAHSAIDRSVFAEGAMHAAQWAVSQPPGLYGMDDVLGLTTT